MEKDLFKLVIEGHKDKIDPKALINEGLEAMIYKAREEGVGKISGIYEAELYLRRDIKQAEIKLEKMKESLAKYKTQIEQVEKGDFSSLYKDANQQN